MTKVVLLSQFPLPYAHIGSWTTMYRNYLQSSHEIDTIICESPVQRFENVRYQIVTQSPFLQWRKKISKNNHLGYIEAFAEIFRPDEHYILQVVDNFGLAKALQQYIEKKGIRKNCYLQFFYHGHVPSEPGYNNVFFEKTDEIVVLTHSAYEAFRNKFNVLPSRFSVLYNGIDTQKFHPITAEAKSELKKKHGFEGKKIFMWCSQDRPKKGLHLMLDSWKILHKMHPEAILLVIGCEPKEPQSGVFYGGRIANDLLPQYYQMSDAYLFPTLCQEGFGMSLIEALHCGCYCIASAMGGVPEVLQNGKLGQLIEKPHFVDEWIAAIENYLKHPQTFDISRDLYTAQQWNERMTALIQSAKRHFD
ncbi:glycosyltransferase family 4 protein [Flavobacterium sp.]|uniref:glycosyltransferase family 4 protein n=1 Tax=Flavobacterium sp. TaxID=239 RepID=UPI0039E5A5E2